MSFPKSSMEGDIVCDEIHTIDDNSLECSHNFTVAITSATLDTMFFSPQSEATITILDNDSELQNTHILMYNSLLAFSICKFEYYDINFWSF